MKDIKAIHKAKIRQKQKNNKTKLQIQKTNFVNIKLKVIKY